LGGTIQLRGEATGGSHLLIANRRPEDVKNSRPCSQALSVAPKLGKFITGKGSRPEAGGSRERLARRVEQSAVERLHPHIVGNRRCGANLPLAKVCGVPEMV